MHLFGILVAIGAYLVVNVIAIAEYREFCSYYPKCFNSDVKALNYIMFFMGVVCIILELVYCILMPFYIMDVFNQRKKYKEQAKDFRVSEAQVYDSKTLKHSVLYSQNNLNQKNAGTNYQSPISVKNLIYEYPVQRDQV